MIVDGRRPSCQAHLQYVFIGSVLYNEIKSDLESGINTKILLFTAKFSRTRIKLSNIFRASIMGKPTMKPMMA